MGNRQEYQRMDELAKKLKEGTITPEERSEYLEWLDQQDDSIVQIPTSFAESREALEERILQQVQQQMALPDVSTGAIAPMRRNGRRWYRYAAAAILIACAGLAVMKLFSIKKTEQPLVQERPRYQQELMPGGNKAVLTLADGTAILLDSAQNGNLARQGNTQIIKLGNGQILYNVDGHAKSVGLNTMSTPRGGQYRLTLPDGTSVWLNASSSITYPAAFTGNERNVSITGEVYFEVSKDRARPFRVNVNGRSEVEVLGTHFNINSYEEEGSIRTTLLEGSVKVVAGHETVMLRPGQQASKGQGQMKVIDHPDINEIMAWKNGYFQFNRTDLRTVMRQLARWYDVEVVYEGKVPNDTFIGELPMNAPASQILKALEEIQVHFRIEGKRIIVTP